MGRGSLDHARGVEAAAFPPVRDLNAWPRPAFALFDERSSQVFLSSVSCPGSRDDFVRKKHRVGLTFASVNTCLGNDDLWGTEDAGVLPVAWQAREEMEYAGESKDTTYFDEEAAAAKEAVEEAVGLFESLLSEVGPEKRDEIMRSSGLRVEQLKAELDELLASDDH